MKKGPVIFLPFPASLEADLRHYGSFELDPDILLPVELEVNETSLDPAKLSWEMIIAGMLRIILDSPAEISDEWISYYRSFVISVRPDIFQEFSRAAEVKAAKGDLKEAQEIRAILSKLFPDSSGDALNEESFKQAYELINGGEDEKGLVKVKEFIEKWPRVWNGWFLLGWALRKLSRYADALEAFKKANELKVQELKAHELKAHELNINKPDGGARTFGSADIQNEMAICLMELGDLKAARRELELALREEPESIKIISNLGVLAQKAGNRAEAEAFFRIVLDMDPEDPLARHFLF
ncbi:MAG: tetratricopeptide repeat protein [Treponema sp.]|nr:tetratricopeptide repeat protein [Treponema sp.]